MVEITIGWSGQLEGSEADVVQGLVVDDLHLIGVLNELMNRQGGVVWLDDGVRDLWGWENGESLHDSVWVLFSDLGDQEGSHARTRSTTEGVADLESLETVAAFGFLSDDVEDGVDEFSTLGVVTLGPVVSGSGLAEDEVVWSEELTERTGSDGVHGSWLQVHEDGSWDVSTAGGFVEVDVDSLQLEITVTLVGTSWVNAMLIRDDFPELGTDLVTALSGLDVDYLSHLLLFMFASGLESR